MASPHIRPAARADLPAIAAIYAHYVLHTAVTFDVEPWTSAARDAWFADHTGGPGHRLFVADAAGRVVGYAGTGTFRTKPAYATTVETTVYLAPDAVGRAVGTGLFTALLAAIADDDVHRLVAGITLPNPASIALHRRFGFTEVGTFHENGRKLGRFWDVVWLERPLR
jgi:phosphinothricin acetyltransferase